MTNQAPKPQLGVPRWGGGRTRDFHVHDAGFQLGINPRQSHYCYYYVDWPHDIHNNKKPPHWWVVVTSI